MLSRRVIAIARGRALASTRADAAIMSKGWKVAGSYSRRAKFHSTNLLQAETVKVPQMAESISEGTLKTWLKQPGDSVQADEEVATIETDKIDVSVNAPASGKITELLAQEEDTVTVGQDLFRFEPGAVEEAAPKEQKPEVTAEKAEPKAAPPPPKPAPEEVRAKETAGVQAVESKKEFAQGSPSTERQGGEGG
ncbi:Dihydrolipoyllysine-residue succinyltransferase component of 2-oxoglutarate dehydrogenase complex [Grifola frondosa]|uniref:Dihydrolipoyllysine-residue succinyltransferase component of 2-oxoglutarate dehydrogenase complex n=1 Tax=Grifola frondosa TaxID=5627 RepID=A0A1C7LT79_GRIFR|nr:Dihydrolipoyllysine-residue succinyltransferase component of 2-oxoglutarate dehydrogenase complex [Grifola frondosa]